MSTLYIRDVPEDVADRLKRRAEAAGQSLSAYVAAQLTDLAARPTNAEIAARLRTRERSQAVTTDAIVAALRDERR